MAYIVRMPKLGVEMQSGVVLAWLVEEGEDVSEDDVLAEIESEKTVADVTARESGTLRQVFLEEGAEIEPGGAMGIVAGADEDISELHQSVGQDDSAGGENGTTADVAEDESGTPEQTDTGPEQTAQSSANTAHSASMTPKARQLLHDHDLEPSTIQGTGPNGSITAADVERAVAGPTPPSSPATPTERDLTDQSAGTDAPELVTPRARKRAASLDVPLERVSGTGPHGSIRETDVERATSTPTQPEAGKSVEVGAEHESLTLLEERPLTGMRTTIARRLSSSWEAPHVTVDRWVNAEPLLEASEEAPEVVSMTDVLLKAISDTLAQHPEFNATFENGTHYIYDEHNIGFAVDVDAGLVTPVLKEVQHMSMQELAHQRGALTDRVMRQRQRPADLQGGTFTVSNLGVFGVESFTPIINPPQVAILGVNRLKEEPRRTDRGIEFKSVIGFSLSFDHRVIDGADAARFLDTLATVLDDATALLEQ